MVLAARFLLLCRLTSVTPGLKPTNPHFPRPDISISPLLCELLANIWLNYLLESGLIFIQ